MVPSLGNACRQSAYSPRIRGDGPERNTAWFPHPRFSPYSRGWSRGPAGPAGPAGILPVFAGMVHRAFSFSACEANSPRIRGDGPRRLIITRNLHRFSPYSRGWSENKARVFTGIKILPVFAGMVPCELYESGIDFDSPRIRGDGPGRCLPLYTRNTFSPYSRGWSHCSSESLNTTRILPVFAGMVPQPPLY